MGKGTVGIIIIMGAIGVIIAPSFQGLIGLVSSDCDNIVEAWGDECRQGGMAVFLMLQIVAPFLIVGGIADLVARAIAHVLNR